MRRPLIPALFAAALLTPLPALADCPPESAGWFCEDSKVDKQPQQAPSDDDSNVNDDDNKPTLPKAQQIPEDDETPTIDPDRSPVQRPRVVVIEQPGGYATPPPNVVIVTQRHPRPQQPRYVPAPRMAPPQISRPQRLYSKWGFNLRVEGAAMGDGTSIDAGIGGLGMSLRYRPIPAFGFDLGVDVIGGKDFNGFQRIETPVSLNAMIFVNPRSRVQFYLMGGAHLSHAQVRSDVSSPLLGRTEDGKYGADYNYFGGQGGAGLEFRLGKRVGLSFDALAFIRKRTDDGRQPEYVEANTGRTTNTSAGVLLRGGLNFWW